MHMNVFLKKILCPVTAAVVLMTCVLFGSFAAFADELPAPDPHPGSYLQTVHV